MTVAQILNMKGRDVLTVKEKDTILAIAVSMSEKSIGSAVIVDSENRPLGIISERDILRATAKFGAKAVDMLVQDMMTPNPKCCTAEDSISHIMDVMTKNRFRHMPVVENGKLCGIISIGDVVKIRVQQMQQESEMLKDYISAG